MTLQRLLSYVRRAVDDYNMIENGDIIAVAISGGKDSLTLLTALNALQRFYPKKFELKAISVNLGFENMDFAGVRSFCQLINVEYCVVNTDIGEIIFTHRKEKNPCSLCAKMRKGAMYEEIKRLGCNKTALGHNRDDVLETFFMSLFFEGRINVFSPVTYLDKKDLTTIRPLVYVPETEVKSFAYKNNLPILKNKCIADGNTKRETIKKFIKEQGKLYDHFEEKIFGAIKRNELNGWRFS